MSILFHTLGVRYLLRHKREIRATVKLMCESKGYRVGEVNYILCSKRVIKETNVRYLDHHYYTDIITFPMSEEAGVVSADIYVCVPVVFENAVHFKTSAYTELIRVLFHGILHLIGYDDHTPEDQLAMRAAEEEWLGKFAEML